MAEFPSWAVKQSHRRLLERATHRIWAELRSLASRETQLGPLRAVEHEPVSGTKPVYLLEDSRETRYALKVAERPLMMAEQVVDRLRQLARRPSIPARVANVDVEGLGVVEGLLKPFVPFDAGRVLSSDSADWSSMQRAVIMREHVWEWFVGNLDTNTTQFALIGPSSYPVNIDWDRSFCEEASTEVSRFAKYRQTLPNAHTFLYSDYVEGRVPLDLALLRREARHIRKLPVDEVEAALREYAMTRYEQPCDQHAFLSHMMLRKHSVERVFARFERALTRERATIVRSGDDLTTRARVKMLLAWHQWQVLLDAAAHSPPAHAARSTLRWMRAKNLGQPATFRTPEGALR